MTAERIPTSSSDAVEPNLRRPTAQLGPRAQQTVTRILDATRDVFLAQGYGGTSIDDIAQRAGVSRASFYTYFPTKRDALLALGQDANLDAAALVGELARVHTPVPLDALEQWVERYFRFLDEYGGFALAWGHAAFEDDALRAAGTKSHLRTCRTLGNVLDTLRGTPLGDPATQGLLVFSMLERGWAQSLLYEGAIARNVLAANSAHVLARLVDAS